jgi:glycolate oxidase
MNGTLKNLENELIDLIGEKWVITDRKMMESYLIDETVEGVRPKPSERIILVKPGSAEEISKILRLTSNRGIAVFPRGGGTGLVGGAIPTNDGIVLSLERMNRIEEMDKDNLFAVVQAGVTLGELKERVEREGLFFPIHPGDEGAQVGGLIACNAGGSRAVKHGVMRNYVKGLEVVLADGTGLNLGGKLLKNNTGYSLIDLFAGSEGTLGIITGAILRLYPKPPVYVTLLLPYEKRKYALDAVSDILRGGIIPLAVEYVEKSQVELSAEHLGAEWPCKEGKAQLIVIVSGSNEDTVLEECEKIAEMGKSMEPVIAERKEDQEKILKIRSNIYTSLKPRLRDILDVSVPPGSIAALMDDTERIAGEFNTEIPIYGHAADGNLHIHIMKDVDEKQCSDIKKRIYKRTAELSGTLTAEHGIGKIRKDLLPAFISKSEIGLMKGIKELFDPKGILNPGCKV